MPRCDGKKPDGGTRVAVRVDGAEELCNEQIHGIIIYVLGLADLLYDTVLHNDDHIALGRGLGHLPPRGKAQAVEKRL